MTILKKILTYDKKSKEIVCNSCNGIGKTKTSSISTGSGLFNATLIFVFFVSFNKMFGESTALTSMFWAGLIAAIFSSIVGILSLIEYREQTKEVKA